MVYKVWYICPIIRVFYDQGQYFFLNLNSKNYFHIIIIKNYQHIIIIVALNMKYEMSATIVALISLKMLYYNRYTCH